MSSAMTHMDKLRVFGKAMRVMLSKHQTVQLPKEGQPDAGLTRYTTSIFGIEIDHFKSVNPSLFAKKYVIKTIKVLPLLSNTVK